MKKSAAFAALLVCATLAAGGLEVGEIKNKTLPTDVYTKLAKGKKLSLFWKDASVDFGKGWALARVEYKAEDLNSGLLEALKTQAANLATPGAPLQATFRVVENHRSWTDRITFVVEGQFLDNKGKVVAAFAEVGSYAESVRNPGKNAVSGVDEVLSKLLKEVK